MSRDDAVLLARAGRGDQTAFAALYDAYETDLYRFVLYLADGPDTAEELFQETWFRVVRNLGRKQVTNFKQWLFTIAANLYRDELRKRKVRRLFVEKERHRVQPVDGGSADPRPSAPYTRPEAEGIAIRDALGKAMNKLTLRQRTVFALVYVEGFKLREVGEILGKPEGTVKSTLHRALELLRCDLKEFHP